MTDADLLACAPIRCVGHETDEETDRDILLQPRFKWRWVQRLFASRKDQRYIRIHLDDLGTWVWRHLDGETPLGDLVGDMERAFPDEPAAQVRLLMFVRQLAGTRLITVARSPAQAGA